MTEKRKLDLVILSDIHLGTYGCQAERLYKYLQSIDPGILILNGDIIDVWAFNKKYFPKSHMKVIGKIIKMASEGTKVHYLLGNHDDAFRRYGNFSMGNIQMGNKLLLDLDGRQTWIFHGDVFDLSIQHTKLLAKLGGKAYDFLILINALVNRICDKFGWEKFSLSRKIKESVKLAVKYVQDFEDMAIEHAILKNYDQVICGHLHSPVIREVKHERGSILYLNSGDWVENCTALEYNQTQWDLYKYEDHRRRSDSDPDRTFDLNIPDLRTLYEDIVFDSGNR